MSVYPGHPVQTEGPHIDGADSRRQAPLPCGLQQLKRGHEGAKWGRGVKGEKLGEQRVKRGDGEMKSIPTEWEPQI